MHNDYVYSVQVIHPWLIPMLISLSLNLVSMWTRHYSLGQESPISRLYKQFLPFIPFQGKGVGKIVSDLP